MRFTYREMQSSMGKIWTLSVWKEEDSEIHSVTLQSKWDKNLAHETGSFIRKLPNGLDNYRRRSGKPMVLIPQWLYGSP
ncbi:MAG: hypothetical protein JSV18_06120 [Candidatus Bathyarchaeota archaeon]|nr:MAG: hypothetical protein JSV18_06120 [Candidatus Bathyarchaeota archaeon]